MRIPARYRCKALMPEAHSRRALEALEAGQSLFLTGVTGSGKTHLAVALMCHWYADALTQRNDGEIFPAKGSPVFLPAAELLLEIKESWHREEDMQAESEKRILDRCAGKPLLVLDDLGAEKTSDWSRQVVYLLIDRRYRNMRQTIITSNRTLGQLAEGLDARIASRIAEMGVVIDMGKKDWRVR